MADVISVSLTKEDIIDLKKIKISDGLGASSVMKVGIQHVKNKPRIQAEQEELKQKNEKLFQVIQKLTKRVHELETEAVKDATIQNN